MQVFTVFPTDDLTRSLPGSDLGDSRVNLQAPDDYVIQDDWTPMQVVSEVPPDFDLRRADCGAGCRCAAEARAHR